MVVEKNIYDYLKIIFIESNRITDNFLVEDLLKFPTLWNFLDFFSNPQQEWRVYFQENLADQLKELSLALKNFSDDSKDRNLFLAIEDQIKFVERNKGGNSGQVYSSEILFLEKQLQAELELLPLNRGLKEEYLIIKNRLDVLNSKTQNILDNLVQTERAQNVANQIIEDLKTKNDAYSQLIDEDSNSRIKTLYTEIYNDEIKLANKYRNWALLIFVAVGVILLFGFLNLSIQNWNHLRNSSYIHIPFGWDSLLKTLMLFSLTTPAWYLTRESSKHRKVAYKAKILGTELASFPLYAREFKDEDRLELRKALSDRFFGQELYGDLQTKNSSLDNSLEQIKLLTEANKVLAESLKIKQNI